MISFKFNFGATFETNQVSVTIHPWTTGSNGQTTFSILVQSNGYLCHQLFNCAIRMIVSHLLLAIRWPCANCRKQKVGITMDNRCHCFSRTVHTHMFTIIPCRSSTGDSYPVRTSQYFVQPIHIYIDLVRLQTSIVWPACCDSNSNSLRL